MKKQTRFHSALFGRLLISAKAAQLLSTTGILLALFRSAWTGSDELNAEDLANWKRSPQNRRRGLFVLRDRHGTKFYLIAKPDLSAVKILLPEEL